MLYGLLVFAFEAGFGVWLEDLGPSMTSVVGSYRVGPRQVRNSGYVCNSHIGVMLGPF